MRILKTARDIALSHFLGRAIRFVYAILIARTLGPNDFGVFSYAMAVYLSLLALGGLGHHTLLSHRLGRRTASSAWVPAHSFVAAIAQVSLAAVLGAIYVAALETDERTAQLVLVFLIALIVRGAALWARQYFVGAEDARWIPLLEGAFRGAELAAGATALAFGGGLLTLAIIHVLAYALEGACAVGIAVRRSGLSLSQRIRSRALRAVFRASGAHVAAAFLLSLIAQVGVIELKVLQTDSAIVGNFALAMQAFTTLMVIPVSLSSALLPGLARAQVARDKAAAAEFLSLLRLSLLAGALAALLAWAPSPEFFATAFGEAYREGGRAFALLCWSLGPYAVLFKACEALATLRREGSAIFALVLCVSVHVAGLAMFGDADPLAAAAASLAAGCALAVLVASPAITAALGHDAALWAVKPTTAVSASALVLWLQPFGALVGAFLALLAYVMACTALQAITPAELRRLVDRLGWRQAKLRS